LAREVFDSSKPIVEVAKAYGVGAETLRRWVLKYREVRGGTDADVTVS
jgi:transposase